MIKKILRKILFWIGSDHLNLTKTIFVNYLLLSPRDFIKFPILIYGPCKLGQLTGKIVFFSSVKRGMLTIGESDAVRSCASVSYINIQGRLEIGNGVHMRRGIRLDILSSGQLILGNNVYIGDNNTIISFISIKFGQATRVGNNSTFMDTDFHYVINIATRDVKAYQAPIVIGENCWIGGWCTIKKNTNLPKGTIVAGPFSMTSKDYTQKISESSLIAGSPAKLVVENMRRVNNDISSKMINEFYDDMNNAQKLFH